MNNEKLKIAIYGYAPHGLKIDTSYYEDTKPQTLSYLDDEESVYVRVKRKSGQYVHDLLQSYDLEYIKPYLFSASALCKEIQLSDYNNGEPFMPAVELLKNCSMTGLTEDFISRVQMGQKVIESFATGEILNYLNRWKIDYRGLIEEGLAIEVNEINNPYL